MRALFWALLFAHCHTLFFISSKAVYTNLNIAKTPCFPQ